MRFTQLIETFVITNDQFEDYLNRSTEQLKSELDMGKNLRDAIHDLARSFADMHNKSYEAYERMSDSLLARSHILELGNDSATIDQEPTDIEPEMDMGEPEMDMGEPAMDLEPDMDESKTGDMMRDDEKKRGNKRYGKHDKHGWHSTSSPDPEDWERLKAKGYKLVKEAGRSKPEEEKRLSSLYIQLEKMKKSNDLGGIELTQNLIVQAKKNLENMKEETIKEGPCDVATKDDISKMSGEEYDKYAQWKKDCESEERTTPLSTKRLSAGALYASESYDDYHGDMSKEDYDKTVKNAEMEYTVWAGGTEVNDDWLNKEDAIALYNKYSKEGYDDIAIDTRIKRPVSEETTEEGNEFSGELAKAKIDGKKEFKVGGKKYKVEEDESEGNPYIVFHTKKGKFETHADTSYDAAKKAAAHWKLKSTGGLTVKLSDVEHVADADTHEDVLQSPDKDKEQAIDARDDFMKVMDKKPKGANAIDTIKKIVADKQNMQVKFDDGKMKVDLFTASAVSQVYDAVKPETQAKMDHLLRTKEGMLKIASFAMKGMTEGYAPGMHPNSIATRAKPGLPKTGAAKPAGVPAVKPAAKAGVGAGNAAGSKATQIKPGWNKAGAAGASGAKVGATAGIGKKVLGKAGPVGVAMAVGSGLKKGAKALGKVIGNASARSGFGNPLSASKYSESKAADIMAEAMDSVVKEDWDAKKKAKKVKNEDKTPKIKLSNVKPGVKIKVKSPKEPYPKTYQTGNPHKDPVSFKAAYRT